MGFSSKLKLSPSLDLFLCAMICFTFTHDLMMQLTVEMGTEQFERMLFVSWHRLLMRKLSFWSIDFCNYWIGHLDYLIKWKSSRQVIQLLHNACTYGILVEDSILNRHKNCRHKGVPLPRTKERLCILKKNGPQIINLLWIYPDTEISTIK